MLCVLLSVLAAPLCWESLVNPIPHTRYLLGLPPPRWSIQRLVQHLQRHRALALAWPRPVTLGHQVLPIDAPHAEVLLEDSQNREIQQPAPTLEATCPKKH